MDLARGPKERGKEAEALDVVHVEVGQEDVEPLDRRVNGGSEPTDAGPGIEHENGAIGARSRPRRRCCPVTRRFGPELASDPRVPHRRMFIGSVAPRTWRGHRGADRASPPVESGHHERTQNAVSAHDPQRSVYRRTLANGDGRGWVAGSARWRPFVRDAKAVVQSANDTWPPSSKSRPSRASAASLTKTRSPAASTTKVGTARPWASWRTRISSTGLGHDYTPRRLKRSTEWLIEGLRGNAL